MEQPGAEMLLELRNLARDSRLADLAFPSHGGKRARLDHPDENIQRPDQVHLFHHSAQKSYPELLDYIRPSSGLSPRHRKTGRNTDPTAERSVPRWPRQMTGPKIGERP
jgi:hypothetical protein